MTSPPHPGQPASAGVHVPPPFVYALAFLAGYFLHRWHPLPITADDAGAAAAWLLRAGAAFVCIWLLLALPALALFWRHKTSPIPDRPSRTLVTTGPYRLTRNPMYLSLVALYIGLACFLNSWWPLFLLPVVIAVIDRMIIAREERYLATAFPAEYAAYRARVRRWF